MLAKKRIGDVQSECILWCSHWLVDINKLIVTLAFGKLILTSKGVEVKAWVSLMSVNISSEFRETYRGH